MTIVTMRTGYALEYVPAKGRKARREFVADLAPAEIKDADDLKVAVEVLVKGEWKPQTWVHEGLLYAPFENGMTIPEFEAMMKGRRAAPTLATWGLRRDLMWQDLGRADVFAGALRDDAAIREIREDGVESGRAFAQEMASHFLVHDGRIFMRVEAPTILLAHPWTTGKETEIRFEPRFRSGQGASAVTHSRAFRPDDYDGINDWAERNASCDWKRYGADTDAYPSRWTEDGLAAEDMLSWWTIWSARHIFYDTAGKDWNMINAGGDVLRCLAGLRDVMDRCPAFLPGVAEAADLALDIAASFEELAELTEGDSRYRNVNAFLRYMLAERRHALELEDAPTLSTLTP